LFLRQLGWSLFQGLGITPSSTISGKERLRGGDESASILWWKKRFETFPGQVLRREKQKPD
jgi:hypothetical protein